MNRARECARVSKGVCPPLRVDHRALNRNVSAPIMGFLEAEQLMDAVKALHPDEMSPREALEALYRLKLLAGKANK